MIQVGRTGAFCLQTVTIFVRILSWAACATTVFAQTDYIPVRGLQPGVTYTASGSDTIDVVSGSVFMRLPITSTPPSRAGMSHDLSLRYSSRLNDVYYDFSTSAAPNSILHPPGTPLLTTRLRQSPQGGWRFGYQYKLWLQQRPYISLLCPAYVYSLSVEFPDGSRHHLQMKDHAEQEGYTETAPDGSRTCGLSREVGPFTYYTIDGTYIKVTLAEYGAPVAFQNQQWTISFPDGSSATGRADQTDSISDRNGNRIFVSNVVLNGIPTVYISDDLGVSGRAITIESTLSDQDRVTQSGFGGTQAVWTIHYRSDPVSITYPANDEGHQLTEKRSSTERRQHYGPGKRG